MRRSFCLIFLLVFFLPALTSCGVLSFSRSMPAPEVFEERTVQPTDTVQSSGSEVYPTATSAAQDEDNGQAADKSISCDDVFCQVEWTGWLVRPFSEPNRDHIDQTYPYASWGDGSLAIHNGVEFPNPYGTPIRAAADGQVLYAGNDEEMTLGLYPNFYGNVVILKHNGLFNGKDVFTLYGHLSMINVNADDLIKEGNILGEVGASGVAGGSHLHFEVRYGGNKYHNSTNPVLWFSPLANMTLGQTSTLAGVISDPSGKLVSEAALTLEKLSGDGEVEEHYYLQTYAQDGINSHPLLNENFVIPDLPPGDYRLSYISGRMYEIFFTLDQGMLGFINLQID